MFASAQNASSTPLVLKNSGATRTPKSRNLALDLGAALLWPTVAVGSFIFGSAATIEPSSAPYKSEIKLAK